MDTQVLKSKFKESFFIGGISFAAPFLGAMFYAYHVLGWSWPASKIAGIALSMFKKLLVAYDGSEDSQKALEMPDPARA